MKNWASFLCEGRRLCCLIGAAGSDPTVVLKRSAASASGGTGTGRTAGFLPGAAYIPIQIQVAVGGKMHTAGLDIEVCPVLLANRF